MADNGQDSLQEVPYFPMIVGHEPYPWQRRLYAELCHGNVPDTVAIPTGLGKTLCVLLFALARLRSQALPTRVVYVVDRRVDVDHAADAIRVWIDRIAANPALARAFHACAVFPSERPIALGALRGGWADDGVWWVDPARPAVIVGSVDTIGSRLLFSGYGDGRSRRPLHAGLLGHDALVMLDEAYPSPAMGELLRAVVRLQSRPEFQSMVLSATTPETGAVLGLSPQDLMCDAVRRRLRARKSARFLPVASQAERIATLCKAAAAHRTGAIAVFVESVADARRVANRLVRELDGDGAGRVALLTGTLRGRERAALRAGSLWRRFAPGRERSGDEPSVYLVSTAAGEAGVDLSADHAVMDVSSLDSMMQRLGRVNRTGSGDATVTIVHTEREAEVRERTPTTFGERLHAARQRTLEVLRSLPDLSPESFRQLSPATFAACSVLSAPRARLDAAVVEAFALTSAGLELPPVSVYLRETAGEFDLADTFLAWRWDVAHLARLGPEAAKEALSFFRPRPGELARVSAPFARRLVHEALGRREGRGLPLVVLGAGGEAWAAVARDLADLPPLDYATVILPASAGGLSASGLPLERAPGPVSDVGDGEDRLRYVVPRGAEGGGGRALPAWVDRAIELRIPMPGGGGGDSEPRALVYALREPDPAVQTGDGDLTWLGASAETIEEHGARVGAAARRTGTALRLPEPLVAALETAGRWHDRGKARRVWQRAVGVPTEGPVLAKSTLGRLRPEWLGGYRHEFGSLAEAERELPADSPHRELVLHLIAAHHGWGRPGFPEQAHWDPDDASRSNRARAVRAAKRFARLQARHGPWRLAWLEALVKAADARASSEARR